MAQQGHSVCTQVPNLHPSSVFQCLRHVLHNKTSLSQQGPCFLWFVLFWSLQWCHGQGVSEQAPAARIVRVGPAARARPRAAAGLSARKPDPAAKSSSCLQGLLETPSAGIPLGWEQSLPDALAGSLCLRTPWGQGNPKGFTSRLPSSSLPEGVIKVQGFLFSFFPYPGGLYLKIDETCGKTCYLPHVLGPKLWLASPSATCL